ncbi:MAG: YlbF family regulator [Phycisphaerae bacterium]
MADESMDEILEQARHLGQLIQEHPYYQRLREADAAVRDDAEATKALEAYNQAATAIQEKEQKGRPVEPEEKRNLDTLRNEVVASEPIKAFSQAQANYADLMRRMNEAIFQSIARADQEAAGGGDGGGATEADTGGEGPSIITP